MKVKNSNKEKDKEKIKGKRVISKNREGSKKRKKDYIGSIRINKQLLIEIGMRNIYKSYN